MSVEGGRPTINVTDSAVDKLKEMLAEQDDPDLSFRVFIRTGGYDGTPPRSTMRSSSEAGCGFLLTRRVLGYWRDGDRLRELGHRHWVCDPQSQRNLDLWVRTLL